MRHEPESPLPDDALRETERDESGRQHPIRAAEREAEHLRDIAARGESAATPVILIGTWIVVVVPLVAIVVGLAFGAAYLVTGSTGTSYPPAPASGSATQRPAQTGVSAGRSIFAGNCSPCHGATGHGGNGGPDLTAIPSATNRAVVVHQVTDGGGGMPPFKGTLDRQQIEEVATYVTEVVTKKAPS